MKAAGLTGAPYVAPYLLTKNLLLAPPQPMVRDVQVKGIEGDLLPGDLRWTSASALQGRLSGKIARKISGNCQDTARPHLRSSVSAANERGASNSGRVAGCDLLAGSSSFRRRRPSRRRRGHDAKPRTATVEPRTGFGRSRSRIRSRAIHSACTLR